MIDIKYSKVIKEDIIPDLMHIEKQVYKPQYRGTYESIKARYLKNNDTFVLAYDGKEMIGYMCSLPISQKLYDDIINTDIFHDDDIQPDDIELYHNGVNIYLLSIAILPEHQNSAVIIRMVKAFYSFLYEMKKNGILIKEIIASAVTQDGEKLLKNMNFTEFKRKDSQYTLYRLDYAKEAERYEE